MSAKFEIYKDNANEIRFRLNAANGENIGVSDGYSDMAGATNGIESVKTNSADDNRFEVFEGKDGKSYFRLKAANGEIILSSQAYSSSSAATEGTQAVKRAAVGAEVVDLR